jgi:hypothetical protein
VNVIVGFAPSKPAEFAMLKINRQLDRVQELQVPRSSGIAAKWGRE